MLSREFDREFEVSVAVPVEGNRLFGGAIISTEHSRGSGGKTDSVGNQWL
jgi:hypothetical protein